MIGLTMCSGIGAPEVAAPWVDWRFASEIDKFPRTVLQERFGYKLPEDQNQGEPLLWGDMTEITPELLRSRGIPLPEIVVAGTPCQAFSIAGKREGVADERGNLTLKFVEIIHAIVDARPDGKLAVLWENVPGVLSDKENAFGCFLAGLVGADDALCTPTGESWPSEGMVEGARSRIAWRVLDAQYFGVAQRRKRVFVVADFGNSVDPAAVLFERNGVQGNIEACRGKGQDVAEYASHGLASGKEVTGPILASCGEKQWLGNQEAFNGEYHVVPISYAIKATAIGRDPKNGGNGLGISRESCPTLTAQDQHARAYSFQPRSPDGVPRIGTGGIVPTLDTMSGGGREPCVFGQSFVRRLMPIECARLQGFPDNHCAIQWRGKDAPDGLQYKAFGNSMAVPNIAWIINRMKISMEAAQ